jgi:aminoglycoside phosphotransferase (APT) family kinase protein
MVATQLSSEEQSRLETALTAVCHEAGLDPAGAQLVKYTMNAVYRLGSAGIVVRIAPGTMADRVDRVVQAAAMFTKAGAPVVTLAPGYAQAIHVDDWAASVWTLLPQPPDKVWSPDDLARPLRAIHAIDDPLTSLHRWNTVAKARQRLNAIDALDEQERRYLHDWSAQVGISLDEIVSRLHTWCDQLDEAITHVRWHLPHGVIHGDAHTGNLLVGPDGRSLLCDLDSVALGPREWDLVPAAHGAARFGRDLGWYRTFADAYGFNITTWSGWDTLRQIRELQLVTSVIASLHGRPAVADQLAHRLRSIFADHKAATWRRYQ